MWNGGGGVKLKVTVKKWLAGLEEIGKETYFKRFQDEQAPHLKGKKKAAR